ncbi:MAG: DegT/DnrJ/EryC1/StrS family aminotransferase [Polyangiales bacterium]
MTEMIRLARPHFDEQEEAAAARVLRSGMLVQGPEVAAFEKETLAALGATPEIDAVAVSNGTSALELALAALDVGPGDEVIVPSVTWPSPGNAVLLRGAVPVVCDVLPTTFNIDPKAVAKLLTPKTRAIIAVDQFGVPADIAGIRRVAGDIPIVEDAACAIGSTIDGSACGLQGDLGTFSFHPRKVVTTGEGGMVLSWRRELVTRVRTLRNHGQVEVGIFREAGPNERMSEMQAAIGRVQMRKLDEILRIRRAIGDEIRGALALAWQKIPAKATVNYQTLGFVLPKPAAGPRKPARDAIVKALREDGVEANILSYALHRLPPFAAHAVNTARELPYADAIVESGVALPIHTRMSSSDVSKVIEAVRRRVDFALGHTDVTL